MVSGVVPPPLYGPIVHKLCVEENRYIYRCIDRLKKSQNVLFKKTHNYIEWTGQLEPLPFKIIYTKIILQHAMTLVVKQFLARVMLAPSLYIVSIYRKDNWCI